ncbi:hypothetical protein [Mycolicibacterium iranicum]|uniref:AMP-dependent synthetase/ligase domain-containing protein n=1 Tax=Mycolicibacterium iranicum TaxID=912594 RepID=A0ABT4HK79_MYCIR|nr:hypothetical protein [Mycolicibacterium iranicum]MCZ0730575.1 hypothetical protein [Mycolicibacterium iranicum]
MTSTGRFELDLHEQRPGIIARGDLIVAGTTAAEGYGDTPRERVAFIVTTIRSHLRQTRVAEAASSDSIVRNGREGFVGVSRCPAWMRHNFGGRCTQLFIAN